MVRNVDHHDTSSSAVNPDALAPGHNSAGSWASWKAIEVEVARLSQAADDPRSFTRADIAKATSILRRFGPMVPIPLDADGTVIAGWLLVLAAQRLGLETLPAIRIDIVSGPKARELSLALNRFLELGHFDQQRLGKLVLELEAAIPDFSPTEIGFEATEIYLAIASLEERAPDILPPLGSVPVTPPGGVWQLGSHRIGHGNATCPATISRLTGGTPVAAMIADPPYGCPVQGFVTSRPHREFVEGSEDVDPAALSELFRGLNAAALPSLRPGALVYLFIDWRALEMLIAAASAIYGPLLNLLVWAKDRAGMGSFYRSQHELVLVHKVPGGRHRNNVQLGKNGRNHSNLLTYASAQSFGGNSMDAKTLAGHPTPKNLDLVADLILDCTERGEAVLDPFLGSGTTLIAAEKTGRVAFGLDLDQLYVDLAVRRWQAWTGEEAVLVGTGQRFADLEAKVEATHG